MGVMIAQIKYVPVRDLTPEHLVFIMKEGIPYFVWENQAHTQLVFAELDSDTRSGTVEDLCREWDRLLTERYGD